MVTLRTMYIFLNDLKTHLLIGLKSSECQRDTGAAALCEALLAALALPCWPHPGGAFLGRQVGVLQPDIKCLQTYSMDSGYTE